MSKTVFGSNYIGISLEGDALPRDVLTLSGSPAQRIGGTDKIASQAIKRSTRLPSICIVGEHRGTNYPSEMDIIELNDLRLPITIQKGQDSFQIFQPLTIVTH